MIVINCAQVVHVEKKVPYKVEVPVEKIVHVPFEKIVEKFVKVPYDRWVDDIWGFLVFFSYEEHLNLELKSFWVNLAKKTSKTIQTFIVTEKELTFSFFKFLIFQQTLSS